MTRVTKAYYVFAFFIVYKKINQHLLPVNLEWSRPPKKVPQILAVVALLAVLGVLQLLLVVLVVLVGLLLVVVLVLVVMLEIVVLLIMQATVFFPSAWDFLRAPLFFSILLIASVLVDFRANFD